MSIDVRFQPIAVDAQAPPEELLEQPGIPKQVQVVVTAGQQLPFAQGPGQPPLVVPAGNYTFSLGKDDALQFAKVIQEAAEKLPDESDIAIATDLNSVEDFANHLGSIRDNPQG